MMQPLLVECSTSVDMVMVLEETDGWGEALAIFCFLGLEAEENAVRMEPFGSCQLEVRF